MSGWFNTLGYWHQDEAYAAFDEYRDDPTPERFDKAVVLAIPIIRVVTSTQKFKINYGGDEEDLVSHAALTITKALPKMILKPKEKLDNDKKYMRYLFTCVINAFYREYDILHGKHNKLQRKLNRQLEESPTYHSSVNNVRHIEAVMTLKRLPQQLYDLGVSMIRFEGQPENVCAYIIRQLVDGREISKSVLHLMGCSHRAFFVTYCNNLLYRAFIQLKDYSENDEDIEFDVSALDQSELEVLNIDLSTYNEYTDFEEYEVGGVEYEE